MDDMPIDREEWGAAMKPTETQPERCQSCQGALTTAYEKERGAHQYCETPTTRMKNAAEDCVDWFAYHVTPMSDGVKANVALNLRSILAAHAPQGQQCGTLQGALVAALVPLEALITSGEVDVTRTSAICPELKEEILAAVELGRKTLAAPPVPETPGQQTRLIQEGSYWRCEDCGVVGLFHGGNSDHKPSCAVNAAVPRVPQEEEKK